MPYQERERSKPARRASQQAAASPVGTDGSPRGARLPLLWPGTGVSRCLVLGEGWSRASCSSLATSPSLFRHVFVHLWAMKWGAKHQSMT